MPEFIRLPAAFVSSSSATIAEIMLNEGDSVAEGSVVCSVETDKATIDVTASTTGLLAKFFTLPGDEIDVGAPIAIILHEGENLDNFVVDGGPGAGSSNAQDCSTTGSNSEKTIIPEVEDNSPTVPNSHSTPGSTRIFASPLARKLAKEEGIDLTLVQGTGPSGRIVRDDVKSASVKNENAILENKVDSAPQRESTHTDEGVRGILVPHTRMRKTIASRLTTSKQEVPHYYLQIEVDVTEAESFRKVVNSSGEQRISLNDLIIKAAGVALRDVPETNVMWQEDGLLKLDRCDVSIAVSVPGGILTPVQQSVDAVSVSELSRRTTSAVKDCRDGNLNNIDLSGGSMTVSNLGMYGVSSFAAILNPPQSMILAVGAATDRVVAVDGLPKVVKMSTMTLSCDHRAIDGATGAQWLSRFREALQNPVSHLV